MKRCLLFVLLLFASHAWAQSCPVGTPQTPNVGLYLPVQGSPYWGYCVNGTSSKLDSLLSGLTALPALSVTGAFNVGGLSTFNNLTINGTFHCLGGGCLFLQTNGVPNGNPSLLNLQQGANITLTDNGLGQILITASSTAATAWSAITTGTNTQGLHMGAGGSLDTTGGGTISATSVPAAGLGAGTITNNTSGLAAGLSSPLALSGLAPQAADTFVLNATAGSAAPTAVALPACANDGAHALTYPSHVPTCSAIIAGTGSVTHTAGALTLNAGMFGNGSADSKVDTNFTTDGSGNLTAASFKTTGSSALVFGVNAAPTTTTNQFSIFGPATTPSAYGWQVPATAPTNGQTLVFGTPVLGVVPITYGTGASTTGTVTYLFKGVCQAGTSSASVNFPSTNSPSYVSCATSATSKWQIPITST